MVRLTEGGMRVTEGEKGAGRHIKLEEGDCLFIFVCCKANVFHFLFFLIK